VSQFVHYILFCLKTLRRQMTLSLYKHSALRHVSSLHACVNRLGLFLVISASLFC